MKYYLLMPSNHEMYFLKSSGRSYLEFQPETSCPTHCKDCFPAGTGKKEIKSGKDRIYGQWRGPIWVIFPGDDVPAENLHPAPHCSLLGGEGGGRREDF